MVFVRRPRTTIGNGMPVHVSKYQRGRNVATYQEINVLIALYRAEGTYLDRLIRWRTRSIYSHVELVIGSSWYTSSPRDGGVRRREIAPKPGHWDFVAAEVDPERVIRLWAATDGEGYDWLGIVGHAVGIPRIHSYGRWTCSEWVAEALGLGRAWRWTPEGLAQWAG